MNTDEQTDSHRRIPRGDRVFYLSAVGKPAKISLYVNWYAWVIWLVTVWFHRKNSMAFQPIRILVTHPCSAIINMADKFQNVCKRYSLDALKPFQEETITQLLKGRDLFLSVKTDGGNSICYQGFQLMWTELNGCECSVLIVSPLLSIMKEQCEYLRSCEFT